MEACQGCSHTTVAAPVANLAVDDPTSQDLPQQQQQHYPGDFVYGRDGARDFVFSEDADDVDEDLMFQEPKQLGYDKIDLPDEMAKFVKISDVVNYLERREGMKTKAIEKCQGNHHSPYEVRLFLGPDAVVEGSALPCEDRHVTIGLTTYQGGFRLYHRQVKAEIDPKKVSNLLHRVASFLKATAC